MHATVRGTTTRPEVLLDVEPGEVHSLDGVPIEAWIRRLPRAWRRDGDGEVWVTTAVGPDAADELAAAGFTVTVDGALADDGVGIADLATPLATVHPEAPDAARVYPRLAGIELTAELLGPRAVYDRPTGTFTVPRSALVPPPGGVKIAETLTLTSWPPDLPDEVQVAAARLAAAQDLDDPEDAAAAELVAEAVGDIPDWFGLELDPYQRAGALAAVAGHAAIADPPGLGKTRQILAALAAFGACRSVIVTPPFPVVTHWEREVAASGLAEHSGTDGAVVTWQSGRKLPPLPPTGVLLVPDTLLAARPEVVEAISEWAPDGFAVDEVHRAKSWWAQRSQAVRKTARTCSGIRLAASGTPMLANVHEMASMLAITGHLKRTFGGLVRFETEFCVQNKFGGWNSRRRALPRLKELLDDQVWVRRRKVMPTAKRRYVEFIDPDLTVWRKANADVYATIDRFLARVLAEKGRPPTDAEVNKWARDELGLITQMRRAAGLAKVEGIAEKAAAWVEGYTEVDEDTGTITYERPLIIWTWHQEVSEALAKAVPAKVGEAGVIIGSTKPKERSRLVDAYQAGKIPVLVCSIPTVGVGVTLTRGADSWFAETDFTPALISQAEDRQHRRGQQRDVRVTTFIAPGTLDERIQNILARKAEELNQVLSGGDNDVTVLNQSSREDQEAILLELVRERVPVVQRRRRSRAA